MTSFQKKDAYIPTLDGLRAIAILLVIASHTEHFDRANAQTRHGVPGLVGVLIFFALSGFLITSRLLLEFQATGEISLRDFYIRRAFRILPPSLLYLGITAILAATGIIACSTPAILSALFFYKNYVDYGDLQWRVAHFWSLSAEEHFYLVWPALLIASGIRKGWKVAAALAITVSIWRIFDDRFHIFPGFYQSSNRRTDQFADTLLWGCCLAFYWRIPTRPKLTNATATTLSIVCFAALLVPSFIGIPHVTFLLHFLPTLLLGSILIAPQAPIGRLLEIWPLRFIGKISYSLYLWQEMFLGGEQTPFQLFEASIFIFVAALLSYYLIEKPCIAYGKRFIARRTLIAVTEAKT
jgi:peptidoglycan/LPS O-acetylase OafA/YrhL